MLGVEHPRGLLAGRTACAAEALRPGGPWCRTSRPARASRARLPAHAPFREATPGWEMQAGISVDPWSCSETVSIAEVDRGYPACSFSGSRAPGCCEPAVPGANREQLSGCRKPARGGKAAGTVAGSSGAARERAAWGAPVGGRRSGSWRLRPLTRAWWKRSWLLGVSASRRGRRVATGSVRGRAVSPASGRKRRRPGKRRTVRRSSTAGIGFVPPRRASRARPKLEGGVNQPLHLREKRGNPAVFTGARVVDRLQKSVRGIFSRAVAAARKGRGGGGE
jgi:hypothetical protein